jgi:hypothetical protein
VSDDAPARLADERGGLDTPEDEAEMARYMRLLGGMTGEPDELRGHYTLEVSDWNST